MTAKALEKINGTPYQTTLEYKRKQRKYLEEAGHAQAAESAKASIAGYCQALRDCGIITERERGALFLYYGTV
jgi:hypothetical protein